MGRIYVGISGYDYRDWQGEGRFYPPGLKKAGYLGYYASRYRTVEYLGATRQMPADSSVAKWLHETSGDFRVAVKMHEQVTHRARLKPESGPVLKSFVEKLKPVEEEHRLAPLLIQLPPNMKRNDDLLAAFLSEIPQRDSLPLAVEFRNSSWNAPEVESILRENNVAWVAAETDDAEAELRDTSRHVYVRLRKLSYSDDELKRWAEYLSEQSAKGKECYVYCRHKDVDAPWIWADRLVERTS